VTQADAAADLKQSTEGSAPAVMGFCLTDGEATDPPTRRAP